ncbi:MAG: LytR C-terminal domain-containing protein [bacterium]|nr:LytR C-terminal domain-containing protein [bacterium]
MKLLAASVTTKPSFKSSISQLKIPKMSYRRLAVGVPVVLLLVGLSLTSGYFYWRYKQATIGNSAQAVEQTIKRVSKLMQLPPGTPTLATVSSKEALESQWFFRNAENGDKVLIYQDEKRAILYRPSNHKIIEVSTINIDNANGEVAGATDVAPVATPKPNLNSTLALYNGTITPGLTRKAETFLKENFQDLTITTRGNTVSGRFEKSQVINVTGQNPSEAEALAQLLSTTVSTLPEGEATPSADILIILGTDAQELTP